jgi:uncharacterized peroxidase-related enzyme
MDAWIRMVPPEEAEGRLKEVYDWQAKQLGFVADLTMIGSLAPEVAAARLNLYRAGEQCSSGVTPFERQYISYLTSILNAGEYCRSGSEIRLRQGGIGDDPLAAIREGRYDDFPPKIAEMLRYVHKLTVDPGAMLEEDVARLREVGWEDVDVLDINNHCAHCALTNRITLGLGLLDPLSPDIDTWAAIPEKPLDRAGTAAPAA